MYDTDAVAMFVDRLLVLEERKAGVAADLKVVLEDAKSRGIPGSFLRPLVAERHDDAKRQRAAPVRAFIEAAHQSLDSRDGV